MKILLAAALILLSGCQPLLSSPIGTPSTTRLPIERLPLGTPHVQLTPNATKDRWTIHVRNNSTTSRKFIRSSNRQHVATSSGPWHL